MTILIMLKSMSPTVKGGIPPSNNAKEFLELISLKFKESEKAKMGSLINKQTYMRYAGNGCVRVHILNMIDVGMNLRGYEVNIDDNMLFHLALNSLPTNFKQIKSSYVAQKESWSINELIAMCLGRTKHQEGEISQSCQYGPRHETYQERWKQGKK